MASDTGELKRDWSLGVETIDTPKSQAVMGWVGNAQLRLTRRDVRSRDPKATAAVTSLDGQPIASSKKMLVTVVAQVGTASGDRLPFLAEPVEGTIAVRTSLPLRMIPLSPKAYPARHRGNRGARCDPCP